MYAEKLDDMQRRIKASGKPINITVLSTCSRNTPAFEEWSAKFLADDNTTIHMTMEDDFSTFSFWEIAHA